MSLNATITTQPQAPLPRGNLARAISAQKAAASHRLLIALEDGGVDDVRTAILQTPEGLRRSALLSKSFDGRHLLRTPLMVAVRTGNYAIFTTILNSINRLFRSGSARRRLEIRKQMLERDRDGLTVSMHAARGGHVVVIGTVLKEMLGSDANEALTTKDYRQWTLLMHAAAAGNAAGLQEVVKSVEMVLTEKQLAEHIALRSGDDRTLLMIAAASGDKMTFKVCVEAIRFAIIPSNFRTMLEERDADGMTFLMHAANPNSRSNDAIGQTRATASRVADAAAPFPNMRTQTSNCGSDISSNPPVRAPAAGNEDVLSRRLVQNEVVVRDNETMLQKVTPAETSVGGESKSSATDDQGVSMPRSDPDAVDGRTRSSGQEVAGMTTQGQKHKLQQKQQEEHFFLSTGMAKDPRVPVLKAAVLLNKECLWKDQVRDMLQAIDSWGRTVISHGILSGSPHMFVVAMEAVRADVLDEEVQELLESRNESDEQELLAMAKSVSGKDMETSVRKQLNDLKRDVEARAKASTLVAKIQSFIPGKFIVIFQLLLPEVPQSESSHSRLILLVVMSCLAPILAWASGLVNIRGTSVDEFRPRRNFLSYCLSAPAMFVWGVGTSNILEDDFDWPESRAAAVLAVGTIVIPSVDSFIGSKRVQQWSDKCCLSNWRFSRKAELNWRNEKEKHTVSTRRTTGAKPSRKVGAAPTPTRSPVNPGFDAAGGNDLAEKGATHDTTPTSIGIAHDTNEATHKTDEAIHNTNKVTYNTNEAIYNTDEATHKTTEAIYNTHEAAQKTPPLWRPPFSE